MSRCTRFKWTRREPSEGGLTRAISAFVSLVALILTGPLAGCEKPESAGSDPVVLYCSVDETFARQVLEQYQRDTGRRVQLLSDSEAGKTTGLVKRIRLERDHPRADVFWSSEQSQTVLLAREGLLAPYDSPSAADIPDHYKDEQRLWTGFALRARVVAYDPQRTSADELPGTWEELAEPKYAARLALANPLFGTTRGHVSAMYALWGAERFRTFLSHLVEGGATVADGNSTAVRKLIAGDVDLALTDSDDVLTARRRGHAVAMIFPEMGDGGTMLIPNTVALVAGSSRVEDARHLIDFILSPAVEELLARSDSGNYPARAALRERLDIPLPSASKVSADDIADAMPAAVQACQEILRK